MTITLEELKKMKLKGIRSVVPAKPRPKDLKGVNFPIKTLVGKEIIVIDWIKVEHGVINPAKPPIKIQFLSRRHIGRLLHVFGRLRAVFRGILSFERRQGRPVPYTHLPRRQEILHGGHRQ